MGDEGKSKPLPEAPGVHCLGEGSGGISLRTADIVERVREGWASPSVELLSLELSFFNLRRFAIGAWDTSSRENLREMVLRGLYDNNNKIIISEISYTKEKWSKKTQLTRPGDRHRM